MLDFLWGLGGHVTPAEAEIEEQSALSLRGQYDTMNYMQNAKFAK